MFDRRDSSPRAVLFADSHLQPRAWGRRPELCGDAYHSFRQIVDLAIRLEVPLIGAGDLLDRRLNGAETISVLKQECDRLQAAGQMLYFVQGQHELDDVPWFQVGDGVHVDRKEFRLGGIRGYGLDFRHAENLGEALDGIPEGTDLLVCHQVWSEFMGDIAHPQGSLASVPRVPLVFTGDYHVNNSLLLTAADGHSLRVHSPGSTCMQSIDEPPEKYCGVLSGDGRIRWEQLATRVAMQFSVSEEESERFLASVGGRLEACKERAEALDLPPELQRPIWWVWYEAAAEQLVPALERMTAGLVHLFWKAVPTEGEVAEPVAVSSRGEAATLSSCFDAAATDFPPEVADLGRRLVDAVDPRAELDRWLLERAT